MPKSKTYEEFVDKFKVKHTTDDCFTPPNVYEAVAQWVENEYHIDRARFVRPFWPGMDYQTFDYPADAVVVDNPPFSILASVLRYYISHSIPFFLFCQSLTCFDFFRRNVNVCLIPLNINVTFENGASIAIGFVTNLEPSGIRSAPSLYKVVEAANKENVKKKHHSLPKYKYPDNVLTASMISQLSKFGVDFKVDARELRHASCLDSQRPAHKHIFGGGVFISQKAAAEKAAAEKAAAEKAAEKVFVWELSDREWDIIHELDKAAES